MEGERGVECFEVVVDLGFKGNLVYCVFDFGKNFARIRDRTGGLWVSQLAVTALDGGKGLMDPTL